MSAEGSNVPAVVEIATPVAATLHSAVPVPVMIANAGDHAARRFLEFFAASIGNENTRMAYLPRRVLVLRLARLILYRRSRRYRAAPCRGLYQDAEGIGGRQAGG